MNAGRDVERVIAGWLEEEAAARAPDRVLGAARQSISRTGQRRLVVAWREPMYVSPLRLAGMAAVFAVAVVGAAWFGRMTASSGVGGTPIATPTPTASAEATIAQYRAARNQICTRYAAELNPLKPQLNGIYDAATTAADRATKVQALTRIADRADEMIGELQALTVPAAVAADHNTQLARLQDTTSLIRQALARVAAGDLAGAQALDLATDPLSRNVEAFESKYQLAACP
jgi:hypothetical protein